MADMKANDRRGSYGPIGDMAGNEEAANRGGLFLFLRIVGLRLLLLLGDVLRRLWRLIDQRGGLAVFLALGNQGEPRASHGEKGTFALVVAALLSKPHALSRVRSIFPGVRHRAHTSKDTPNRETATNQIRSRSAKPASVAFKIGH
jgi:hypothetical protein